MVDVAADRSTCPHYTAEIDAVLQRIMLRGRNRSTAYGPQFSHIWDLANSCLTGGKLLRPRLLMEVFDALTPDQDGIRWLKEPSTSSRAEVRRDATLEIAAGIELLHYAFVIHDDLIDEDLTRRGKPNLMGSLLKEMEEPRGTETLGETENPVQNQSKDVHFVRSVGLLVGDLMLSSAHHVFATADLPRSARLRLLDLVDHTVTESCVGELKDVGLSDGVLDPALEATLEMTRLKTATYTFEFPLRAAAILAGASIDIEATLASIGRDLGVAFQLQDDILSAFGDEFVHGKDAYSDFREGKETPLIAFARTTSAWPAIQQRFGADDFKCTDGELLSSLLRECGAEEFVRTMISELFERVVTSASSKLAAGSPSLARCIVDLAASLEGRAT